MENLYSFGDSHADFSFRGIIEDPLKRINFGPITMHRVRRDKINFLELYKHQFKKDVPKNSTVFFCFGEIDVRCHVKNQTEEQKRSAEEIIDNLVGDYIEHIKTQKQFFDRIGVLSITPPACISWAFGNSQYPFVGSNEERVLYTKTANSLLKEKCRDNNIMFLDVFNDYADENGLLTSEVSNDGVHIKNTNFVKEKLKQLL
ncbi:MAG: hypothetical protein KatS3mg035_1158 [Bacteroidia bacterium]|nr:MAG: hypothetical protein KatS3mg035_1158 [Bacteroidia bacterium]